MPRYFIDIDDGTVRVRDEEGENCADLDQARAIAISSLPGIADGMLPDGESHTFTATLRNEADATVYVAALTFEGAWKIDAPLE